MIPGDLTRRRRIRAELAFVLRSCYVRSLPGKGSDRSRAHGRTVKVVCYIRLKWQDHLISCCQQSLKSQLGLAGDHDLPYHIICQGCDTRLTRSFSGDTSTRGSEMQSADHSSGSRIPRPVASTSKPGPPLDPYARLSFHPASPHRIRESCPSWDACASC